LIHTLKYPHLYYFEILDCKKEINSTFKTGNIPRLLHEIRITTEKG